MKPLHQQKKSNNLLIPCGLIKRKGKYTLFVSNF